MAGPLRRYACLVLGACALPALAPAQTTVVEYYHLDALGTVRAVTNQAGEVVERHDFLPYGDEWCGTAPCSAPTQGQPLRFTGKERDAETGLDYFGARYYGSKTGRFTTVDPVYTWQENLVDPQRWNRYAYARNNPLRYTDPDGRAVVLANGAGAPKKPGPNAGALAWIAYTIDVAFFGVDPLMVMPVGKASKVVGALGKVDEAVDLTKGGTYVLKNTEDAVMRTGRSKDLARRAGEHRRAEATRDLEFQVDRRTDVYAEQRGREQVIHDAHNPPLDKVNPISPKNPRRQEYLDAAKGVEQK